MRPEPISENEDFDVAHAAAARRRRLVLPLLVLAPTVLATRLMVDVLDAGGLSWLETALVALFAVLFAGVSFGFWTVLAGLSVKLRGGDPRAHGGSHGQPAVRARGLRSRVRPGDGRGTALPG